jgi:hypothetical protein
MKIKILIHPIGIIAGIIASILFLYLAHVCDAGFKAISSAKLKKEVKDVARTISEETGYPEMVAEYVIYNFIRESLNKDKKNNPPPYNRSDRDLKYEILN